MCKEMLYSIQAIRFRHQNKLANSVSNSNDVYIGSVQQRVSLEIHSMRLKLIRSGLRSDFATFIPHLSSFFHSTLSYADVCFSVLITLSARTARFYYSQRRKCLTLHGDNSLPATKTLEVRIRRASVALCFCVNPNGSQVE